MHDNLATEMQAKADTGSLIAIEGLIHVVHANREDTLHYMSTRDHLDCVCVFCDVEGISCFKREVGGKLINYIACSKCFDLEEKRSPFITA